MPTFPIRTIEVLEGATDVSLYLQVYTSGGAASTGLIAVDVSTARFVRDRQTTVSISASNLAAVDSVHADGGMKEISAAQFPGLYRFDMPDAAFAAVTRSSNKVRVKLTFSDGGSSESEALEIVLIKAEDDIWNAVRTELASMTDAPATPKSGNALMLIYMALRNKIITDSNLNNTKVHKDGGTALGTAAVSDAGGIFTRDKYS